MDESRTPLLKCYDIKESQLSLTHNQQIMSIFTVRERSSMHLVPSFVLCKNILVFFYFLDSKK